MRYRAAQAHLSCFNGAAIETIAEMTAERAGAYGRSARLEQWGRDQLIAELMAGLIPYDVVGSVRLLQWGRAHLICGIDPFFAQNHPRPERLHRFNGAAIS